MAVERGNFPCFSASDSVNSIYSSDEYNYGVNSMQSDENKPSLRRLQRPRGALARQLYDKLLADERLEDFDKSKWYECDLRDMPTHLAERFVQMGLDEETEAFLDQSRAKSDWIFTQLWHSFARSILGWFMTQTSINGLLGRGSMFVFSKKQFIQLISGLILPPYQEACDIKVLERNSCRNRPVDQKFDRLNDDSGAVDSGGVVLDIGPDLVLNGSLLDLGAGDGGITEIIAPFFKSVFVTEISPTMKRTLAKKGFHVLDVSSWYEEDSLRLSIAMCLNLLDRCDTPLTLLSTLRDILKRNAVHNPLLIVALVLPYSTYVEAGSRQDHKPTETITINGNTFEEQVASVEKDLFIPAGFQVLRWTRLPYLCEGDLRQAYYWLSDSVFVLAPIPDLHHSNGGYKPS
ncbi:protein-L-histidine N-pros-methyltransferase [Ischnura elegans]|uniref:protein-L-histidine N-pros-methyltransferase n=1 Tax=Ischnura elegans TaxID=197161 RepID=UPI001ED893C3|nr:protein-L-histidine N-pros-methyltransferase [Ischnura elegans]